MRITAMDHFTVTTDNLGESIAFYAALGLDPGPRPDFPVAGSWLYTGGRAVLHLVETTSDLMPAVRRGALDHMAFRGTGLVSVVKWPRGQDIPCSLIRAPAPFTQWQLFFSDPNGVEVEIDFDRDEIPPEAWKSFAGRRA
ncbi:VOC family protein [Sphingomonas sp. BAUL-RG-20F-R05-02]|uniref:VOC family protein n=1 Tax=Sphingomonas sp. BAUL-RG-20F-R05-02 TaxID=2914830 RepID=UPI001F59A4BF|nr:VOC family protein [Sphingomonas sp. BAUL-RG-20F-R05-02]